MDGVKAWLERSRVWDNLMLRERMKAAVAEAIGAHKAEKLFPPSTDTLKIRLPVQYKRGTEWMG